MEWFAEMIMKFHRVFLSSSDPFFSKRIIRFFKFDGSKLLYLTFLLVRLNWIVFIRATQNCELMC